MTETKIYSLHRKILMTLLIVLYLQDFVLQLYTAIKTKFRQLKYYVLHISHLRHYRSQM